MSNELTKNYKTMSNTFKGYSKPVQTEINAINEREQIQAIVNASFEPNEKRVFNTLLICVCSAFIVVPTVLHLI